MIVPARRAYLIRNPAFALNLQSEIHNLQSQIRSQTPSPPITNRESQIVNPPDSRWLVPMNMIKYSS